MVDVQTATAAARSDRYAERILQGAAFERGINTGLDDGAGEIRGEDRTMVLIHQRCSTNQESAHNAPRRAILGTPPPAGRSAAAPPVGLLADAGGPADPPLGDGQG